MNVEKCACRCPRSGTWWGTTRTWPRRATTMSRFSSKVFLASFMSYFSSKILSTISKFFSCKVLYPHSFFPPVPRFYIPHSCFSPVPRFYIHILAFHQFQDSISTFLLFTSSKVLYPYSCFSPVPR